MKLTLATVAAAALVVAAASAADINVVGAQDTPMMRTASDDNTAAAGVDVKIATADILNKPTALINKNTLAMDNNVFVSRSNIAFSQNDRLAMAKKVEAMVTSASDASDMTTAVLSKNILKAVSGSDSDAAMMTKASAVVAAKDEPSVRGQRIADLVNAVFDMKTKTDTEQSIQSQTPNGVIVLIGTKDILRQPTAVVNKNVAVSDNQIAVSRSNLASSQNDAVAMAGSAKVADAVMPASAIRSTESENESAGEMDTNYRVGFLYNKEAGAVADSGDKKATDKEQFGLWGGGLGFGWRYPLGYWNLYGAGLYGGGCGLGMPFGSFFYC